MNGVKGLIPAAGFGTRFLPVSKSVPKEMLPILDKPSIHYIIDEGIKSGIKDFVIQLSIFLRLIPTNLHQVISVEEIYQT